MNTLARAAAEITETAKSNNGKSHMLVQKSTSWTPPLCWWQDSSSGILGRLDDHFTNGAEDLGTKVAITAVFVTLMTVGLFFVMHVPLIIGWVGEHVLIWAGKIEKDRMRAKAEKEVELDELRRWEPEEEEEVHGIDWAHDSRTALPKPADRTAGLRKRSRYARERMRERGIHLVLGVPAGQMPVEDERIEKFFADVVPVAAKFVENTRLVKEPLKQKPAEEAPAQEEPANEEQAETDIGRKEVPQEDEAPIPNDTRALSAVSVD